MSTVTDSVSESGRRVASLPLAKVWHKSAPRRIRHAYLSGRDQEGWIAWQRRIRSRKLDASLVWSDATTVHAVCVAEPSEKDLADAATQWLYEVPTGPYTRSYAESAIDWARKMPQLANVLPSDVWWAMLEHLTRSAAEAGAAFVADQGSQQDPLVWQLLAGELALTLARLFPEITMCRKLFREARRTLTAGPDDLLDGKGLLHAQHFELFWPLLACWTRCNTIGKHWKNGCWNCRTAKQYAQMVRNALRFARPDGSQTFGDAAVGSSGTKMLTTAVRLSDCLENRAIAAKVLRPASGKVASKGSKLKKFPKSAVHSEWAAAATLRPEWSRSSPALSVLYPGSSCCVELSCGKELLWSGPWSLDLQIDGVPREPSSDWSQLCWVSDKDVDYLELEMDFGPGVRVQRHFAMARKDGFLFLADAVLASERHTITYSSTLPLCSGIVFRGCCETRHGVLANEKPRAVVLPLAIPERSAKDEENTLAASNEGLQLRHRAEGQSLFAPLFVDLKRQRLQQPLTWRQLTVAELWQVQPPDVAAGYRVAIGKKQWLIYRALSRKGNRSVLGHNISNEMIIAQFDRKGEVQSIIEIE